MADDKSETGPQDAKRVNVNEAFGVGYWMKKFKVHGGRIEAAANNVGAMAADVDNPMKKQNGDSHAGALQ